MRSIQRYGGHLKLTEFHIMAKDFLFVVLSLLSTVTVRLSAMCLFAFSVITSSASITEIFFVLWFLLFLTSLFFPRLEN